MLKHDSNCLETANEKDGTPALLLNCDESNTNQVKIKIPLVEVNFLYYLENGLNVPSKHNNLIPLGLGWSFITFEGGLAILRKLKRFSN